MRRVDVMNCSRLFEYFRDKLLLALVFLFVTNLPAVAGPSTGDDTFFGEPGLAITPFSQANRRLAQSGSAFAAGAASAAPAAQPSVEQHSQQLANWPLVDISLPKSRKPKSNRF